jgi:hypothetical protein
MARDAVASATRDAGDIQCEVGIAPGFSRSPFQGELDALRAREKAHTREGDAIAAARRRLLMVEVDGATPLIGERGAVTLLGSGHETEKSYVKTLSWMP